MATVSQVLPQTLGEPQILNTIITPVAAPSQSQVEALAGLGAPLVQLTTIQVAKTDPEFDQEKQAIYRHPLFPLMALLFEKCEQASQTADCPSSDSFDVDIQAFVHHQEKDGKPFFSDDRDLDALMVKAIQVLRIHLLELEKVTDLCKDFCTRYTTCLKGKLQSENLLRTESDYDDAMFNEPPPQAGSQGALPGLVSPGSGGGQNVIIQSGFQQTTVPGLGPGQIVSGGTVYQMVQTPQGLVAQPIQLQPAGLATGLPTSIIHGSTPLSQIGVSTAQGSTQNSTTIGNALGSLVSVSSMDSDDEDVLGKKKNKRGVLPKSATQIMKSWLFQHIVHPYPTEDEKRQIASQTNLTLLQVNNWFINARRRILQPMLDASNPEQTKAKKSKPVSRPPQRFWPFTAGTTTTAEQTSSSQGETITTTSPVAVSSSAIILPPGAFVTADGQIVNLQGASMNEMLRQVSQTAPSPTRSESDKEGGGDNNNNSNNTDGESAEDSSYLT